MLIIEKYYIVDPQVMSYFTSMDMNFGDIRFDDIYNSDGQTFAIVNTETNSIVDYADTNHLNLDTYLDGMIAGFALGKVDYEFVEKVITLEYWEILRRTLN